MPLSGWHTLNRIPFPPLWRLPLNVVPIRALVREGSETILKLDDWLVVVHKDGRFHLDDCPCIACLPLDEYLAA